MCYRVEIHFDENKILINLFFGKWMKQQASQETLSKTFSRNFTPLWYAARLTCTLIYMNYFEVLSENNWESVLINTKIGKTLLELHLCQNPTTSIERDFNRTICLNLGRAVGSTKTSNHQPRWCNLWRYSHDRVDWKNEKMPTKIIQNCWWIYKEKKHTLADFLCK